MYRSRIRISNGIVALAVDSVTGELTELVNERSGDNLVKNHLPGKHQPMSLSVRNGGTACAVFPADNAHILSEPALRPEISVTERGSSKLIKVVYKKLISDTTVFDIGAAYEAELPEKSCVIKWRLSLDNRSGSTVEKALFPAVHGVYLGGTWRDDSLAFPLNAGELIHNPVETYEKQPSVVGWKWQNYYYSYIIDGVSRTREPDGSFVREASYSGPLSMLWMDYFGEEGGLCLMCRNGGKVASLRTETFGQIRPGMGLSIVHCPPGGKGVWNSPECVTALHDGDWHWAADTYRSEFAPQREPLSRTPEWFRKSPGLAAHYDFKYQCGGVVHRFADIPALFDKAQELGLDHLLLAGWHKDGFDNGFPRYSPDPELGTPEELAASVGKVRGRGGHVSFYLNSRLSNDRYDDLRQQREKWVAKDRDGNCVKEKYGDGGLSFSVMCPNESGWRMTISNAVEWLVKEVGADCVYLDQMCMAPPVLCFNENHSHPHDAWNDGYSLMLREVRSATLGDKMGILYEGVSDLHGQEASGQLISTFFNHHSGAFPELYKYTFPEQILVDMLYPLKGQAMRPVHVAQKGREIMDRAFLIGSYYWCYDLEEDNTFDNDPEMKAYLIRMIRLRREWLDKFGHGVFRDTQGILTATGGLQVKLYTLGSRGILLAIANPSETEGGSVEISGDLGILPGARTEIYSAASPDRPLPGHAQVGKNGVLVEAPAAALAVIHIGFPS